MLQIHVTFLSQKQYSYIAGSYLFETRNKHQIYTIHTHTTQSLKRIPYIVLRPFIYFP